MCAKLLQSHPTLWNPLDCSPPGSSVHGFSRQEYWSGLLCPPPEDLPNPGIKPTSPALEVDYLPLSHKGSPYVWVLFKTIGPRVHQMRIKREKTRPSPEECQGSWVGIHRFGVGAES